MTRHASGTAIHSSRNIRASDLYCGLVAVGLGLIMVVEGRPIWRTVRLLLVVVACTAAAGLARTASRRVGGFALLALGVITTPVGATIAFSYMRTTGLSAKAAGGILAVLGGLGALLSGIAALIVAARGWRRLLAIPIGLVVGYATVVPISTSIYATNVPRPAVGSQTPADRELNYEDASFMTSDSVSLSGWYIPSTNRAAVVLLHGASSTRSNVLNQAVVLARHGYGVLLFDARGHGRSGGRAMDFGWYGDRDIGAAVSYLGTRPDVDSHRIGAVGISMGGEEAIGAMANDPRIKATVAEGATNRVYADKAWLASEYGLRGRIQQAVEWLTYGLTDVLTAASPPISLRLAVARAAPRPVLLIAAGEMADEEFASATIRSVSPSTVEVWVVAGADHVAGLRTEPQEWERRVSSFLDRSLRDGGSS